MSNPVDKVSHGAISPRTALRLLDWSRDRGRGRPRYSKGQAEAGRYRNGDCDSQVPDTD